MHVGKALEDEEEAALQSKVQAEKAEPAPEVAAPVSVPAAKPVEEIPEPPAQRGAHEAPEAPAEEDGAVGDPESFVLNGWYCAKCGSFNRGHSCTACGEEKPADAIQYVCDHCGWTNPDPEHPPRFCPDCGAPFAAADGHK